MGGETAPVQREKVAVSVETRLLDQIRTGGLKPGDALPSERELMREWEIGRPAIREAMQSLESKGLIEIRHGERARVSTPSFERLIGCIGDGMHHLLLHTPGAEQHLRDARRDLEVAMARLAAQSRSDRDLEFMRAHLQAQTENFDDAAGFEKAGHAFHASVIAACGNPFLVAVGEAVMIWLAKFETGRDMQPVVLEQAYKEHRSVYDAIVARDSERAGKVMAVHLENSMTTPSLASTG